MTDNLKIKKAKAFQKCKVTAMKSIRHCFHPDCNDYSINSHILQQNGILKSLIHDDHLYELSIEPFQDHIHQFNRIGVNGAFSFKCFCNKHDNELFAPIEKDIIDFSLYRNRLLFTLRTIYNEIFRKKVNVKLADCLSEKNNDIFPPAIQAKNKEYEELGISDLEHTASFIWDDLKSGTESFVFQLRRFKQIDLCLSSFFDYETTEEINKYRVTHGREMERLSDIFVTTFPYQNESILIMGYKKSASPKVKGYVNTYFKESEKRLLRKISNLLLFQCETWATSESFYNQRIKKCEKYFSIAVAYSRANTNERRFLNINLFGENFCREIRQLDKLGKITRS